MITFMHKRKNSPKSALDSHEGRQERFKDVHTQLSALLRAYAVFRPAPPSRFPLFQVGLVLPELANRALSPRRTSANLHTIFSYLQSDPQYWQPSQSDAVGGDVIQAFLHEFGRVRIPSLFENIRNTDPTMTVSEASLFKAGIDVSAGPSFGTSIGLSNEHANVWQIKLSDISSEEYAGGPLKRLLWTHAEFVFRQILLEIDTDIGVHVGDRSRIAIVTGRFLATTGISKTKVHSKTVNAGAGLDGAARVKISAGFNSEAFVEESFDDHRGISGLHFIVFPVEVLGPFKWRVFRCIDVCDAEDQSETPDSSTDKLHQSQNWHLGQENELIHCGGQDYRDVCESSPQVASESLSSDSSLSGAEDRTDINISAMYDDVSIHNAVNQNLERGPWIDVSHKSIPVPWVDIDIGDNLDVFAMKQCDLAMHYDTLGVEGQEKRISLLRSALRKCRRESAIRALSCLSECYAGGNGVPRSQNDADRLHSVVRNWQNPVSNWFLPLDTLKKDRQFTTSRVPERQILHHLRERLKLTDDSSYSLPTQKMPRSASRSGTLGSSRKHLGKVSQAKKSSTKIPSSNDKHRSLKRNDSNSEVFASRRAHLSPVVSVTSLSKRMKLFKGELDETDERMKELERKIAGVEKEGSGKQQSNALTEEEERLGTHLSNDLIEEMMGAAPSS